MTPSSWDLRPMGPHGDLALKQAAEVRTLGNVVSLPARFPLTSTPFHLPVEPELAPGDGPCIWPRQSRHSNSVHLNDVHDITPPGHVGNHARQPGTCCWGSGRRQRARGDGACDRGPSRPHAALAVVTVPSLLRLPPSVQACSFHFHTVEPCPQDGHGEAPPPGGL